MNLVLVITGGGFTLDDVAGYLVAAIGKTDPLPANPVGVAALQAAMAEVAKPPVAQSVAPLPSMAEAISGHMYVFDDNPYRLARMRMDFDKPAEGTLLLTYYDNTRDRLGLVGLDGQYRFSSAWDGPREFTMGMRGSWTDPQTFVLDYNEVASPNAMMLSVHFDGKRVILEGPGVDWEGTVMIEGQQE